MRRIDNKLDANIVSFGLFLLIPPYFAWKLPTIVGMLLVFLFSLRHFKVGEKGCVYSILLFILLAIFYFSGKITFLSTLIALMLLSMLFIKRQFLFSVYEAFVKIFSITMIPSICEFVLYLVSGDGFAGVKTIMPLNDLKDYSYRAYLFFVLPNTYSFFPRFCSYFDEPGVVGTISSILLAISGYKLQNRKNLIIFIAGLLSFSLYFFIFSIFFIVCFYENKRLRKYTSIFSIIILSLIFVYIKNIESPIIQYYVADRLKVDENKGFSGNNRETEQFSLWFKEFRKSPDYYFGLGRDARDKYGLNVGGASYKDLIVSYGIIGFILLFILFSLWAQKNYRHKELLIFLFIFSSLLYQRPFIFSPLYFSLILFSVNLINYRLQKYESNCNLWSGQLCSRNSMPNR